MTAIAAFRLAAVHGRTSPGTALARWLSARGSEIALVTGDLSHRTRPPAGPSFTFAVFTVLMAVLLWKVIVIRRALARK